MAVMGPVCFGRLMSGKVKCFVQYVESYLLRSELSVSFEINVSSTPGLKSEEKVLFDA